MVTNGVYQTGGRTQYFDWGSNRVAVTKPLRILSVNGPEVTVIRGFLESSNTFEHVRCVYLTNGATLVGFTLTHGGARGLGGGVYGGELRHCVVVGNVAGSGGAAHCTLNDCEVRENNAFEGGGAFEGTLNNCIVYNNNAPQAANHAGFLGDDFSTGSNFIGGQMFYCCTTPLPTNGIGNIANAPLFVDTASGNFRLQFNSPCINSGRNADAPAGLDLDGNPRIVGGTVDVGAYEFPSPQFTLSYAWLCAKSVFQ